MRKAIRGIPILTLLLVAAGVSVYATFFAPWSFVNQLSQPTAPSSIYQGEPKGFAISVAGEDDVCSLTITISGIAKPNAIISVITRLDILKPSWRLYGGANIFLDIKNPDGTLLTTIQNITPHGIGKGAEMFIEFTNTFTTGPVTGEYSITPRMDTMTWVQPA